MFLNTCKRLCLNAPNFEPRSRRHLRLFWVARLEAPYPDSAHQEPLTLPIRIRLIGLRPVDYDDITLHPPGSQGHAEHIRAEIYLDGELH